MRSSCSTFSCSSASLIPFFTVSQLFFFVCLILFCLYPKWNPRKTLNEIVNENLNETLNETLNENPKETLNETLKKP
jgi:hypothetical protein